MFENLPDDINFKIATFLPNYDILNFYKINKISSNIFKEYDLMYHSFYRNHPTVFNLIDNYCYICNFKLTILHFNSNFECMKCGHF